MQPAQQAAQQAAQAQQAQQQVVRPTMPHLQAAQPQQAAGSPRMPVPTPQALMRGFAGIPQAAAPPPGVAGPQHATGLQMASAAAAGQRPMIVAPGVVAPQNAPAGVMPIPSSASLAAAMVAGPQGLPGLPRQVQQRGSGAKRSGGRAAARLPVLSRHVGARRAPSSLLAPGGCTLRASYCCRATTRTRHKCRGVTGRTKLFYKGLFYKTWLTNLASLSNPFGCSGATLLRTNVAE